MQFHFHANQSHFHKNGFALRLALRGRRELGNGLFESIDDLLQLLLNSLPGSKTGALTDREICYSPKIVTAHLFL